MSLKIGKLEAVDLRQAWAHEANDFTPWLATNLDRLNDVTGLKLVLDETEARVGRFAADILAVDILTNKRVLIENQLEQANHGHLGQILTYLSGLEANTIIWIAKGFHDEHISAIRWLNSHTHDDFAFFAVEVSVVRIGDSAAAPLFRVLEKPNNWDRVIYQAASMERGEKPAQLAKEYWEAAFLAHPELKGFRQTGPGGTNVWIELPGLNLVLSLAYSVRTVGWFIRGCNPEEDADVLAYLLQYRETIESSTGVEIKDPGGLQEWNDMDMRDRDNWVKGLAWHLQKRNAILEACKMWPRYIPAVSTESDI